MSKRGDELDFQGRKRSDYWIENHEPSLTVQSDAHLTDIHNILRQWNIGGSDMLDDVALQFADVSEFGDYHDVMLEVKKAETTFMALPSKVREIFGHSVETWLDTAHDEDKRDALVEAGFIEDTRDSSEGTSGVVDGDGATPEPAIDEGGDTPE